MIGHNSRDNVLQYSAGVDAVTLIGVDHKSALTFYNEYETLSRDVEIATIREKPWGMHGYKGKSRGPVRVGIKDDRAIISVMGPLSERLVTLASTIACKFTRLDLQITTKLDSPQPFLAEQLKDAPNLTSLVERGKLWMSFHQSPDGSTVYFNKRTSPSYGRIYDKSREYAYPIGKVWRYEIEIKEDLADRIGQLLVTTQEYERLLVDYVASWFADREICIPIGTRDRPSIPETPTGATGIDNTLKWLNKQVRPSIKWLVDIGLEHKVEEAIGFQLGLTYSEDERIDF